MYPKQRSVFSTQRRTGISHSKKELPPRAMYLHDEKVNNAFVNSLHAHGIFIFHIDYIQIILLFILHHDTQKEMVLTSFSMLIS